MIDIRTQTAGSRLSQSDELELRKTIVMEMDVDDAFALATVLFNDHSAPPQWSKKVASLLLDAGNRCRP